ncbi:MAG: magnesium transporter, partial [Clostridia bacterium]|nr:magnesium transporter [Clostridia bacterium]
MQEIQDIKEVLQILDAQKIEEMVQKQQLAALKDELSRLEGADIAEIFHALPKELYAKVYRILPKELAAQAFAEMDADLQESLIGIFTDRELQSVLAELYLDDTVDMMEEMPASVVKRILSNSTPENRHTINELLRYDSDSAGGLMTTEYMRLNGEMTVEQAFATIRRLAYDKESVYNCYVTDGNRHLIGVVDVKTLLLTPYSKTIAECMNEDVIYFFTDTEKSEVGRAFQKYYFMAFPVVYKEK